ncbi:MAG: tetratricopeptide repeat protein [Gammaproteobacteria bacterium]|nr:tetratricopeptide repeat protein [Gammaproteobacteria bacterium]
MRIQRTVYGLLIICTQVFFFNAYAVTLPYSAGSGLGDDFFDGGERKQPANPATLLRLMEENFFEGISLEGSLTGKQLEEGFRSKGDLSAVVQLAPSLMDKHPEDSTIRALYAIALAAQGHLDKARAMLKRFDDEAEPAYRSMVKALIARHESDLDAALKLTKKAISKDKLHPYPHNILGRIYVDQGQYKKALDSFLEAIKLSSEFAAAYVNAGAIQYASGEYDAAAELFSSAVNLAPAFCEARIGRSLLAEESRNYKLAINDLQECLKYTPTHLEARKRLAYMYMLAGLLKRAEMLASEIDSKEPVYVNLLLGEIYLRMNNPDRAKEVLIKVGSSNLQAAYLLAYASFLQGHVAEAISQAQRIIDASPKSVGTRITYALFSSYIEKGNYNDELSALEKDPVVGAFASFLSANLKAAEDDKSSAMALWKRAENFLPGFSTVGLDAGDIVDGQFSKEVHYLNLGVLLYIKGLYAAALEEFNKGLRENPSSTFGHYFTALTYSSMGDFDKAKSHLRKSLSRAGKFFSANYLMAEAHAKSGDFKAAVNYYNIAVDSKKDAGALVKMGLIFERQGDFLNAEKAYQRFITLYPNNFLGYNQLAWMYAARGEKLDKAIKLASKADRLQPGNASILDTLGWAYFHQKKYKKALAYLEKASHVNKGRDPQILFHIASVYYGMGDEQEAKRKLTQALEITDKFDGSVEARRLLSKLQ